MSGGGSGGGGSGSGSGGGSAGAEVCHRAGLDRGSCTDKCASRLQVEGRQQSHSRKNQSGKAVVKKLPGTTKYETIDQPARSGRVNIRHGVKGWA